MSPNAPFAAPRARTPWGAILRLPSRNRDGGISITAAEPPAASVVGCVIASASSAGAVADIQSVSSEEQIRGHDKNVPGLG
jgi:hypothetical protein